MKPISGRDLDKHKLRYLEAKRLKELQLQKERKQIMEEADERVREHEERLEKFKFNGLKTPKAMLLYEKEL